MNVCQACLRILFHTLGTQYIDQTQQILRRSMIVLGGQAQPAHGIVGILFHAIAVKIGLSQLVLCPDITCLRGIDCFAGLSLRTTPN